MELVEGVYGLTRTFPKSEQFGLINQIQRAAVSVPSNIAEGHGRKNDAEFRRYLYIALGSLSELETQLEIAARLKYVKDDEIASLGDLVLELNRMIFGLIANLPKK
ncbi:MAG: four helix bundle protein [Chloroflexi bacterium]|nr:four helix bundle protein [Chloroflexota bacterium]